MVSIAVGDERFNEEADLPLREYFRRRHAGPLFDYAIASQILTITA
jgi:hypothetical protein